VEINILSAYQGFPVLLLPNKLLHATKGVLQLFSKVTWQIKLRLENFGKQEYIAIS